MSMARAVAAITTNMKSMGIITSMAHAVAVITTNTRSMNITMSTAMKVAAAATLIAVAVTKAAFLAVKRL